MNWQFHHFRVEEEGHRGPSFPTTYAARVPRSGDARYFLIVDGVGGPRLGSLVTAQTGDTLGSLRVPDRQHPSIFVPYYIGPRKDLQQVISHLGTRPESLCTREGNEESETEAVNDQQAGRSLLS